MMESGTSVPSAALALTRMNAEIDVRRVLPSILVPALVIHRAGDECLKVEEGRYVASRIPGARFVELPGRDHLPFVGDQDAIVDEVEEFLTGARPEHRVDRVLTTVLFVLFEEDAATPPTEARPLQSHVRRELALFRGREVQLSEARLFATFDGPARAIRCALNLLDAAARLGLRARAGLHTGECDVLGEKVGGATVRLGEAVAACAPLGETLLSSTVKDLVAGSGLSFEPRGARVLADLPGEWPLFAARIRRPS